ncbi:MAG: EamA family transporter [Gaiellaceae bacterium]
MQPWWSFPAGRVDGSESLLGRLDDVTAPVWLLLAYIVLLGTVVPFVLMVSALHHVPATRVTVVAMLEPVLAALVAFAWLGEEIAGIQLVGGALVLLGIALAQTARIRDV